MKLPGLCLSLEGAWLGFMSIVVSLRGVFSPSPLSLYLPFLSKLPSFPTSALPAYMATIPPVVPPSKPMADPSKLSSTGQIVSHVVPVHEEQGKQVSSLFGPHSKARYSPFGHELLQDEHSVWLDFPHGTEIYSPSEQVEQVEHSAWLKRPHSRDVYSFFEHFLQEVHSVWLSYPHFRDVNSLAEHLRQAEHLALVVFPQWCEMNYPGEQESPQDAHSVWLWLPLNLVTYSPLEHCFTRVHSVWLYKPHSLET